ncbi:MAG TPA: SET domain-containing protein [Candidatus Nitrosotenuis sp.]|nr:SET domain-containing protein [Candidatus Nitrosotenuis sp.]
MLSPKIEKRRSQISGVGLFATQKIKKDEVIWSPTIEHIEKIHIMDFENLDDDEKKQDWIKHSYQIGQFLYKDTDDTRFMNHSCKPNVVDFYNTLIAARDIQPGEELTWDYLPYMNPYLVFECRCGNQNCVGIVKKGVAVGTKPQLF